MKDNLIIDTMTDEEIIKIVIAEVENIEWGITEEFLKIHELVYENEKLVISRIDRDKDNVAIAYLPVKDEYFFYAIYVGITERKIIQRQCHS